jgi:hypothetical protein
MTHANIINVTVQKIPFNIIDVLGLKFQDNIKF